jgi:hypothetical protein
MQMIVRMIADFVAVCNNSLNKMGVLFGMPAQDEKSCPSLVIGQQL